MKYNGREMSKAQFNDLVKTVSARNISKLFHSGRTVRVGFIVDCIMKRSEGANEREVLSIVYEEFRQFVNAQPSGSVVRG
jgi:hypothetical protein